MGSLLKDIYSKAFYNQFTDAAVSAYPAFDKKKFMRFIFDSDWLNMELKERMRHTSLALHQCLPGNFEKAAQVITSIITQLRKNGGGEMSLEYMFFPDYVEIYGIEHYETSVRAMEFITQFTSCEFAVRPFIIRYGDTMMKQMLSWSMHKNDRVRRFASEGVRPRLPWAMAVPALKKDPSSILPILENLKNDASEFVRRSVANNLNDISKDHPLIVTAIAGVWKGISQETDAIIRHGCRTLLKQAHPGMLKYFGVADTTGLQFSKFMINTPLVKIGKSVEFSFILKNTGDEPRTVRLEYAVLYRKKNGQLSRKVFKISERIYRAKEKCIVVRRQSFKIITTRRFYAGVHGVSVIINGEEKKGGKFELVE